MTPLTRLQLTLALALLVFAALLAGCGCIWNMTA
jgi:hypothetical protein